MSYYCYLIHNEYGHTYTGITTNIINRLDAHNGIIKQGAKATRKSSEWKYSVIVGVFNDRSSASSFEWNWKHCKAKSGKWYKTRADNRLNKLNELLNDCKWSHVKILDSLVDKS